MKTRVVDSDTNPCDFIVSRRQKDAVNVAAAGSKDLCPEYMRHGGHIDWRDVQAWRWFGKVINLLLFDTEKRHLCRDRLKGKTIGSPGDQGVRCALILAWLLDNSGIIEKGDSLVWTEGFKAGMEGTDAATVVKATNDFREGVAAAQKCRKERAQVCGVEEDFEDPGA